MQNINRLSIEYIKIKNVKILGESILSLEIFESLVQPAITGFITFKDWQGLTELSTPFAGDDFEICFASNEISSKLTLKYKICSIHEINGDANETARNICFGFCSEWLIDATIRQVSKPYKDKYVHEIIEDLLTECGASINYIEPTKNKLENFVTPLWTPVHSIRHLCSFATNKKNVSGYICWTDLKTDKVNVTTLEYLFKENLGITKTDFVWHSANVHYEGKIDKFTFEQQYDITQFNNVGLNKIVNYSYWFDKNKVIKTSNSIKEYKQKHLAKILPMNNKYLDEKKYWDQTYCSLYPKKADAVESEKDAQELIEGELHTRYSLLFSDIFKLNIVCTGSTDRRVGMLTKVKYPAQNESKTPEHKWYTGNYLIRDIKHIISAAINEHRQILTLCVDGFHNFDNADLAKWT